MRYECGQTLIETLAALAIISIVISAIAISVTTALSNATFNKDQALATQYARQGLEIVTKIRDDNYAAFTAKNGTFCLGKGQTMLGSSVPSCIVPNVDQYIRTVMIQQGGCGANVTKVTVSVAFTNGKCSVGSYCHVQADTSCLSTVNPVQAP